jgi:hypothetical protein
VADIQKFFSEKLPTKLKENPGLSADINNTYLFDIDGAGAWVVDLTKTPGEVREGKIDNAGCVVSAAADDLGTLLDNPASGMMLFTMGKLKVTNIGLALSLQKLLG